jgi:uncharacterized 2Fe-2S/4Fe-4S cluster protein (DUF4445 family)
MPSTVRILPRAGETLLEALRGRGILVSSPCGGKGICGKCTVEIEGMGRLRACGIREQRELTVTVPDLSPMSILSESFWPDPEPLFDPYTGPDELEFGLAVDVGTTTVVVFLEDTKNHRNLGSRSFPNPQHPYGADVISRIHFCREKPEGTEVLHNEIISGIRLNALDLCREKGVDPERIGRISLAGNTTMLHLIKGVNPESLSVYPFTPVFLDEQHLTGLVRDFPNAVSELLPSLSSFVGADIVAGHASVSLNGSDGWKLFLDIGTNGEIVLWNGSRIYACATAAGPAFEGARISCGMPGVDGAICTVNPDGTIETIGNRSPVGLCGSGLVDAVAIMLDQGSVDPGGFMEAPVEISDATGVKLDPQDIRELQLAKGAIAAGVEILMLEAGISHEDVLQVYLAGGFGYALHHWSAARIGLLPQGLEKKLIRAGNTAGLGARLWLHSEEFRNYVRTQKDQMAYVELSEHPEFNDRFVMNLGF